MQRNTLLSALQQLEANKQSLLITEDATSLQDGATDYDCGWIGGCAFYEVIEVGLTYAVVQVGYYLELVKFSDITQAIIINEDNASIVQTIN